MLIKLVIFDEVQESLDSHSIAQMHCKRITLIEEWFHSNNEDSIGRENMRHCQICRSQKWTFTT